MLTLMTLTTSTFQLGSTGGWRPSVSRAPGWGLGLGRLYLPILPAPPHTISCSCLIDSTGTHRTIRISIAFYKGHENTIKEDFIRGLGLLLSPLEPEVEPGPRGAPALGPLLHTLGCFSHLISPHWASRFPELREKKRSRLTPTPPYRLPAPLWPMLPQPQMACLVPLGLNLMHTWPIWNPSGLVCKMELGQSTPKG